MSQLAELVTQAKGAIDEATDIATLDTVRVEYLGKKRAPHSTDDSVA